MPLEPVSAAVPTDEIYERYLKKAIAEINELGDELARAGDELRVPVVGSGHPLADILLLKHAPQPRTSTWVKGSVASIEMPLYFEPGTYEIRARLNAGGTPLSCAMAAGQPCELLIGTHEIKR